MEGFLGAFSQPEDAQVDSGLESLLLCNTSRKKLRLPPAFYVRKFPHLSYIALYGCYVDWASLMFYNTELTYLSVSGMDFINKPLLPDILRILQYQPKLNRLSLELGGPVLMQQMLRVTLPDLKEIQLRGSSHSCLGLMASLSYPNSSTKVKLYLKAGLPADFQKLVVPFLFQHYTAGNPATIVCLSIKGLSDRSRYLEFKVWHGGDMQSGKILSCNVSIDFEAPPRLWKSVVQVLVSTLPLAGVRKLSVYSLYLSTNDWRTKIFKCIPLMQELDLLGNRAMGAIEALVREGNTIEPQDGPKLPLSSLQFVTLRGANFGKHSNNEEMLISFVRSRLEAQVQLDRLVLDDSKRITDVLEDVLRGSVQWLY